MAYQQHSESLDGTSDRSTLPTRGSTADAAYLQGRHEGYQAGRRDGRCEAGRELKGALGEIAAQLLLTQTLLRRWLTGVDTAGKALALRDATDQYLNEPLTVERAVELTTCPPGDGGCHPTCGHCSADPDEIAAGLLWLRTHQDQLQPLEQVAPNRGGGPSGGRDGTPDHIPTRAQIEALDGEIERMYALQLRLDKAERLLDEVITEFPEEESSQEQHERWKTVVREAAAFLDGEGSS